MSATDNDERAARKMNAFRIRATAHALSAFHKIREDRTLDQTFMGMEEDLRKELIVDLLANLRHLVREMGLPYGELDMLAEDHFTEETIAAGYKTEDDNGTDSDKG